MLCARVTKTTALLVFVPLLLALVLGNAVEASAGNFFTRVKETSAYHWGVEGSSYILYPPTIAQGSWKVNSIFGKTTNDLQSIEAGWCWHKHSPFSDQPLFFLQNVLDGAYWWQPHYTDATSGTNHTWRIYWYGTNRWYFYLDGVFRASTWNPNITSAWLYSQAECHDSGDNNYAHWWNLKYYDYRAVQQWKSWPQMSLSIDSSDDLYHYLAVSSTEYYSVHN